MKNYIDAYEDGIRSNATLKREENPFETEPHRGSWFQGWDEADYYRRSAEENARIVALENSYREERDAQIAAMKPDPENWEDYDPTDEYDSCEHQWVGGNDAEEDENGVCFIRKCELCKSREINWVDRYYQPDV